MVFLEWVQDLLDPCFDCHPRARAERPPPRSPGHIVELAASPLAGLRGFAGYHTSVLVAGEEYYFSPCGICSAPKLTSHEAASGNVQRSLIGVSRSSGVDLLDFLTEHFQPGTYDLLRKNCNSFTDCALYFLCGQRLDARFCQIEQLGRAADERARLVQVMSRGEYLPNARALDFDLEAVLALIDVEREGQATSRDHHLSKWPEDDERAHGSTSCGDSQWSKGGGYVSDGSGSTSSGRGGSLELEHPWLGRPEVFDAHRTKPSSGRALGCWEPASPPAQPPYQPSPREPGSPFALGLGAAPLASGLRPPGKRPGGHLPMHHWRSLPQPDACARSELRNLATEGLPAWMMTVDA